MGLIHHQKKKEKKKEHKKGEGQDFATPTKEESVFSTPTTTTILIYDDDDCGDAGNHDLLQEAMQCTGSLPSKGGMKKAVKAKGECDGDDGGNK